MEMHTFTAWLQFEVHTAQCALLKLIEEEDRLRYMEGPQLERSYMELVGNYEETVVKEEMECELLLEKQRMIQTAINRREEIDEAAIDEKINALRKKMTDAAAGDPPLEYAVLTPEQSEALQELYGKIVKEYHPSMNPEMTQAQKALYQRAQQAYRYRDLQALKLIWEMLAASDGSGLEIALKLVLGVSSDDAENVPERNYATDYTFASSLYSCFVPFQEEAAIAEELERCKIETEEKLARLQMLKQSFPFNAQEMLADPAQVEAYKQDLERRMQQAKHEGEQLSHDIQKMIGGERKHG